MNAEDLRQIDELLQKRLAPINERLDKLEARMDGLEQRMEGLEKRMDGLEQRMDGLEQRLDKLEKEFREFRIWVQARFQEQDDKIDRGFAAQTVYINHCIEKLEQKIQEDVEQRIHEQQIWIENRFEPYVKEMGAFLPPAGKTYADLENEVAGLKIRQLDQGTVVRDLNQRLSKLEWRVARPGFGD
ncbi:MAG: hypothetical protein IJ109_10465 [Firmicutes bacterium]|nr:hypothetical protein [Bacillota bacterium]MBQ9016519.1 hypothetical protein [Bacillota bacterium]